MPTARRVSRISRVTGGVRWSRRGGGRRRAAASRRPAPSGAVGLVPGVHRGLAGRLESGAARLAGEGAEGHRRVGRAEGGGADLRDRRGRGVGQHREAVDVGQLALVGGHAERGVALGVLDADIALARGELDVGDLHVVLEVEERLGAQLVRGAPAGIDQTGCGGASSGPPRGVRPRRRRRSPTSSAAWRPARCAFARQASRSRAPAAAPAGEHEARAVGARAAAGRGRARSAPAASSQVSLPPQCDQRCTTGDQPPDIATASQAIVLAHARPRRPGRRSRRR